MAGNTATQKIFNNTLKPRQLKLAMRMAYRCRKSLMIWGAPGIGKSQLVQQFADETFPLNKKHGARVAAMQALADATADFNTIIGDTNTGPIYGKMVTAEDVQATKDGLLNQAFNLVDFRLSQVEPTDLRGIPVPVSCYINLDTNEFVPDHLVTADMNVVKKTTTVWASPEVLTLPADWKGVIFMDEANGAMPIVQAAAYQLFLDRRIGEMKIPDGAFIVAAGNRECDGGVTFQLATPLADRMTHVELSPDLDDWIQDYAMPNLVHADVISYLKARTSDFNTLSPQNANVCKGSSPRSWVTVSDYAHDSDVLGRPADVESVMSVMIEGTVGDDIAARFNTHRKMTVKLPSPKTILEGKVTDANKIEGMDVSLHYALCSNLIYAMVVAHTDYKTNKKLDLGTWSKYATNFLKFLDVSYGVQDTGRSKQMEMLMMSVKSLFENGVFFNHKDVPEYAIFGRKYCGELKKILGKA